MAGEKAEEAEDDLESGDLDGEAILAQGAAPDEPEVEKGEVAGLAQSAGVRVVGEGEQAAAGEEAQGGGDGGAGLGVGRPDGDAGLEQTGARVEVGQAVAGAGDELEELRRAVEEVQDLGQQQQHEGLGEVAQDADGGEHHAREVAVGVADEDARRVPVMGQQGEADAQEGQHEEEREEVGVGGRVRVGSDEVEDVVEDQQAGDHDALRHLDAVDPSQDIDTIRAEDAERGHVDVVEGTEVEKLAASVGLQEGGQHDGGDAEVDEVNDKERDGGEGGDEELVAPSNVEDIVTQTE